MNDGAAAIGGGAEERKLELLPVTDFQAETGKGVRGKVKGKSASTKVIVETIEAGIADFAAKSGRKAP